MSNESELNCEKAESIEKWGEKSPFVGDKADRVETARETLEEC